MEEVNLNEIILDGSAIEFNDLWINSHGELSQPLPVQPEENNNTTLVELNSLNVSDVSDGLSQFLSPYLSSNSVGQALVVERIVDNTLLDLQFGNVNDSFFNGTPNGYIKEESVPVIHIGSGASVPPVTIDSDVSPSLSAPLEFTESNENLQLVHSTIPSVPSSLPASQNWPGTYGFNVSFPPQDKNAKRVSWTYSKVLNKLYVRKDAPCPINFSTNTDMLQDVKVRVMALYSNPDSASEVVTRCMNHVSEDKSLNVSNPEHLVRCESSSASYEVDASTNRYSVLVPFENPSVGQEYSTYIYKFTCFGSCAFGPNRRPLMLVFSLEQGNQVIGRQKVHVKICASPDRDRPTEEKPISCESGTSKKRKQPEYELVSGTIDFTNLISSPRKKAKGQGEKYQISADSEEMYDFLKQMKNLYEICETVRNMPKDAKKELKKYCERKGYTTGFKNKQCK